MFQKKILPPSSEHKRYRLSRIISRETGIVQKYLVLIQYILQNKFVGIGYPTTCPATSSPITGMRAHILVVYAHMCATHTRAHTVPLEKVGKMLTCFFLNCNKKCSCFASSVKKLPWIAFSQCCTCYWAPCFRTVIGLCTKWFVRNCISGRHRPT
jgi:hypothetical protein